MEQRQKNNQGITMISLVVTIVLLLIIAGITIGVFTGKSSMIDKANDSKIYTELKQLQDELRKYRAKGEGERLKKGDYSGQMSNDDLAKEGIEIIREFELSNLNRTVGLVNLSRLSSLSKTNINSTLGNNENTYKFTNQTKIVNNITVDLSKEKLTDFTDVFAIDVFDNTLFYVLNGEIWKLDDQTGNVEKVNEQDLIRTPINEAEGPYTFKEAIYDNSITFEYESDISNVEEKIAEGKWLNREVKVKVT